MFLLDLDPYLSYVHLHVIYERHNRVSPKKSSHLASVGCDGDDQDNCEHHQYYQWVALVLLLQAGCFYVPRWAQKRGDLYGCRVRGQIQLGQKFGHFRYLWENWEGGRVSSLVSSLDRKTVISGMRSGDDEILKEKTKEMVNYLKETKGTHDGWASEF